MAWLFEGSQDREAFTELGSLRPRLQGRIFLGGGVSVLCSRDSGGTGSMQVCGLW